MAVTQHSTSLPLRIVVIGGGTGNSTVVQGLSMPPLDGQGVTAIVNTFDDGGSTGDIRRVYRDLPAVGDLRQCFRAMSRLSAGALQALERRYGGGDASEALKLEGQSPGNLLIAAALQSQLEHGGSFSSGLDIIGELYQAKGRVVPASDDVRTLRFELPDGQMIKGEHQMEETQLANLKGTVIRFNRPTRVSRAAERAIREADMVVLAPGDLYTSIGPNLAVDGMREALQAAKVVVMISNLMNRDRHTAGFTALDYAEEYTRIIGAPVIKRVIVNTQALDSRALEDQVRQFGSRPVEADVTGLEQAGYDVRGFNLLSNDEVVADPNDRLQRNRILHSPVKVAAALHSTYISIND